MAELPFKCFHLVGGHWFCCICKRPASNPKKDNLQRRAASRRHTMEKCVTTFVGASNADIDAAIQNLSQLSNGADPIVTLFTRSIDAFRPTQKRPNPILENFLGSCHKFSIFLLQKKSREWKITTSVDSGRKSLKF